MLSKEEIEEIEQARSNILRGTDIESSALILEKVILDNCILKGGRVDILKLATRQILYFIENSKIRNAGDKHILDYVRENVALKEQVKQQETDKQKIIEKLEEDIVKANEIINDQEYQYIEEVIDEQWERRKYALEILKIVKG